MLTKIRARNWEVDELARKCEQAMLEEHGAQEQRRFNELNDRLKVGRFLVIILTGKMSIIFCVKYCSLHKILSILNSYVVDSF